MEIKNAIALFDALSQETRLLAFRLLVAAGQQGMPAGALSEKLEIPHNSLSFHLNHLSNAGIINSRRDGRSIIYSANYDVMHGLISFMVKDCCSDDFASIHEDQHKGCSIIELADCCDRERKGLG
jgi:ArsR family transcriptional regulator, arsenate/arsenite/antimonite-responsive transcriptional repressor